MGIEMQTGRRQFITGLLAIGLTPKSTWADAGSPSFLSAAALPDGSYVLCGIDADLNITFQLPLPARGHAAAAHPFRPEAIAFARRPGTFAVVIDCATGAQKTILNAPAGRHFYGHGAFSEDGNLLYTTENNFEAGRGVIGLWDVPAGYARVGEWDSGGIGPHDIKRLPGRDTLVVANGGIDTHPDSGRSKLNIPTMRPNLTYIRNGAIVERMELPAQMHKNSIRHLAVAADGRVAFGMQWQGDGHPDALVGIHSPGAQVTLMTAEQDPTRQMQGYVGSIAFSDYGNSIIATSPRGGKAQTYASHSSQMTASRPLADVCGVAALEAGYLLTTGTGAVLSLRNDEVLSAVSTPMHWDNHLIAI
jgi:hypothetical protein